MYRIISESPMVQMNISPIESLVGPPVSQNCLQAVRAKNATQLRNLHSKGFSLDVKDNNGWRPLHYAASLNDKYCLEYLLLPENVEEAGINVQSFNESTPLFLAVGNCAKYAIELLLEHGADPNLCDDFNTTPLIRAAEQIFHPAVEMLIKHGANVNSQNRNGTTALHRAVCMLDVTSLMQHGARLDLKEEYGFTPIFTAALQDKATALKTILMESAKRGDKENLVNEAAEDGATPLYIAAQEGYTEVVEILLEYGADANILTTQGITTLPLQVAVECGQLRCVEMLATRTDKAALKRCDLSLWYSLFLRDELPDRTAILHCLINSGFDLNYAHQESERVMMQVHDLHQDNGSCLFQHKLPPMAYGCMKERQLAGSCVQIMLNSGARASPNNMLDMPPILVALESDKVTFVEEFLRRGAIADVYNNNLQGNLCLLVCLAKSKAFAFMLRMGAEVESLFDHEKFLECKKSYKAKVNSLRMGEEQPVTGWTTGVTANQSAGQASEIMKTCSESNGNSEIENTDSQADEACQSLDAVLTGMPAVFGYESMNIRQVLFKVVLYCGNIPFSSNYLRFFNSDEERQTMLDLVVNVRSLSHYCRLVIRRGIGMNRLIDVRLVNNSLKLPSQLMDYIYCTDLERITPFM